MEEDAVTGGERPDVFGSEPVPRRVTSADVAVVSTMLTRAFATDPVARFLFPSERTYARQLRRYFTWQLEHVFLTRGEAWTTEDLAGAALWMPPRAREVSPLEGLAQLAAATRLLGRRTWRAIRLLEQLERRHPKTTHAYLGTIGTDPDRQRSGIGTALMNVVLDRLDLERTPAYLESSREDNLSFYSRCGFAVTGEVGGPPSDLPRIWLMWREPRNEDPVAAPERSEGAPERPPAPPDDRSPVIGRDG